ncbi:NACHT domain-containing protein [Pseudomonas sp. NPDC089395]|uniref:NACHT domain-containing protein n=1 Tax=Pseudomonas sp. NPDC089395 TaxID=3364460 RepID=UPI0037FEFD9C
MSECANLMVHEIIERTLWYETQNDRASLSQGELHERTEPLLILGEAGMGKSHLLEWLAAAPGYARCTARQLINRHDPRTLLGDAKTLVIDALDEVNAQKEGDAVDLVLRQLGRLGCPHFILSCRVADWRSATGIEAIREQYPLEPLELHLQPFDDDDVTTFLCASLGAEIARTVVEHFNARGLNGLLGNPQTLELISSVAGSGNLPETRSELFSRAVEVLWVEHRDAKAYIQLARETALDAAGAAFAGLILTGSEAIARTSAANSAEGEVPLAEISHLPDGKFIGEMLGTRLFKADGANRFGYVHRRVGEYLGARWLVKQADTPQKRRRLLSMFHSHGLVPASLRGIHAWLAHEPALAQVVISTDPMGVIEYGDADDLTVEQARSLLAALEVLATDNPRFRAWQPYSLRGIAQPELIGDIRRLLTAPDTPFGLCLLLLEAVKGQKIASQLTVYLRRIILDPQMIFAIRRAAGDALSEIDGEDDWSTILHALHGYEDELSTRLAIELIDEIGYERVDDRLIVDLVVAHALNDSGTIGVLLGLKMRLPDSRIEGILDRLAVAAETLGKRYDRPGNDALTDFAYHLTARRVETGGVTAEKLWSWLEPFDASTGYHRESRQQLEILIRREDRLRQAVQRYVLLERPSHHNLWQLAWRLRERSSAFAPTAADVIALLETLDHSDHSDERWRHLVQLTPHDEQNGSEVRAVARRFAAHSTELMEWVENLVAPVLSEWQIKQDERERARRAKQTAAHARQRNDYALHLDEMRSGDYGTVIAPAKAYLKLFNDIGDDVPAHKRVAQWLGDDIGEVAHVGFEAFMVLEPANPTAHDIAESLAKGRYYEAAYIIVAALAERFRNGIGFDDLSDERLMAGLFELRRSHIDDQAGIVGLRDAIETAVQVRGIWGNAMRLYHEPQLQARCTSVDGLYSLVRDERHAELAAELATEWLERFPDMPIGPEAELIDRLVRSGRFESLRRAAAGHLGLTDPERRRNWDAIGLIVDYEPTVARLNASSIEPELLWHLRSRTAGHFGEAVIDLSPIQLEWIIATLRPRWPKVDRPMGTTSGDTNPWDASNYLTQLIHRLGNDTCEDAVAALARLKSAPTDGYTETVKIVIAEQSRIRVEAVYVPPTLEAINAIARNLLPVSAADLQALVLEELSTAQAKVKSDDAESWRGFYDDDGVAFAEERCRDHLLGLLRQGSKVITFDPEAHVAADKEVDIACSAGKLRVPIEVKGQWHSELWRGADKQLEALYTRDWRAEDHGIYLVLWFGDQQPPNKRLRNPGKGMPIPQTAHELRELLVTESKSAREGRVIVFVLDLVRH